MGKQPTKARGCPAPLQITITRSRSLRQASVAYSGGSPIGDDEYTLARVTVFSLDGEPLKETALALTPKGREDDTVVVRIPGPPPGSTSDEIAEHYARARRRLERGVHIPERGFFRLKGAADDPHAPISGDVLTFFELISLGW